MTTFYLGTHRPNWLGLTDVPLFISHQQLRRQKSWARARNNWALDSGGFTEVSTHGAWTISPENYVAAVRRYSEEIGRLDWASPQDWMCEPFITAKTGKTVAEHQRLTIDNYIELRTIAPDLPFIPVLQGWQPDDYLRHVEQYAARGIELGALPLVGVGSVCRRQDTATAGRIFGQLADAGISVHGFGIKSDGLRQYGNVLTSADSMSWSYRARRAAIDRDRYNVMALPPCGKNACNNCLHFALEWRERAMRHLAA